MQNTVNSSVLRMQAERNKRKNLQGRHPRSRVTTENFGCNLPMHGFLPVTRVCSSIQIN